MSWQQLDPDIRQAAERDLTPRQLEVLIHTLNGHSTLKISRALHLAEPTVRMHLERALAKMAPHLQDRKDAA